MASAVKLVGVAASVGSNVVAHTSSQNPDSPELVMVVTA